MKRKLFLAVILALCICCLLVFSVSAEAVADDTTDELTLGACTIANLGEVTIPAPTVGLVYSLDGTTMTASVSGRGTFTGGELVFPSTVIYGGNTYTVTSIAPNLFQGLSYDLYVPDTVTFIGGGDRLGTFGNSTIGKVYIGCGLVGFEREVFSGSKGFTTFICKAKPTYIGKYAFHQNSASSDFAGFELDLTQVTRIEDCAFTKASFLKNGEISFGDCLEYVGSNAFVESKANGSVIIPANCSLNTCCFNGTSFEFACIKVNDGETRELPQELFSGSDSGLTLVIDGYAVANQNHVFTGNNMTVYMPSVAHIQKLATTAGKKSGNERLTKVTFYSCEDGHKYTSASDGTLTDGGEVTSHIYTEETVFFPANCTYFEKYAYVCYCCGSQQVESQGNTLGEHNFAVSQKEATCQSAGYYEYVCVVCDLKESAHFVGAISHNASVVSYELRDASTVTATTRCADCNEVVDISQISLVGKCYIEGYGLFNATLDYVTVTPDGVLMPNSTATFENAVIYFPSFVEVDGAVVEVKTIQGFKAKSIKAIYIPDTVTRIVGGAGVGCFGDIYNLKNVVVGKGVTSLEQEVFCVGSAVYLDEFIFKGVITRIEKYALKYICSNKSATIPYEFNTYLTYVGNQVNVEGTIIREVKIAKGCDLSQKFAFNNANGLLTVYIEGGDTPEQALDLGQEFASNTCTKYLYIKGYVTVSGQAVLAGQADTRIYMESTEAIDFFAAAIKKYPYNDRINKAVFFDCTTCTAWYISNTASRVESKAAVSHSGGVITKNPSSCTQCGTVTESCFICGTVVSTTDVDMLPHQFDGGVIVKMPTENEEGAIQYTCTTCGDVTEKTISKLSVTHKDIIEVVFANGYTQSGVVYTKCTYCSYIVSEEIEPMIIILGYSVRENGTGVICGYKFNIEVLQYCYGNMESFEFGFIVANAEDVSNYGLLNDTLSLADGVRGLMVKLDVKRYSYFDVSIIGADTDEKRNKDFIIAIYVLSDSNGDGERDVCFAQPSMNGGDDKPINWGSTTLNTISINRAF